MAFATTLSAGSELSEGYVKSTTLEWSVWKPEEWRMNTKYFANWTSPRPDEGGVCQSASSSQQAPPLAENVVDHFSLPIPLVDVQGADQMVEDAVDLLNERGAGEIMDLGNVVIKDSWRMVT